MAAAAAIGVTLFAVATGGQNGSESHASVATEAPAEPLTPEASTSDPDEPLDDISVGQCFDVTYSDWEDDTEFASDEVPCFEAHTLEVVDVYYGSETIDELSGGCATSVDEYLGYTSQDKETAVHRFTAAVRSPSDDSPTVCVVSALRDELAISATRFYSVEESLEDYIASNGWNKWAMCEEYDQDAQETTASGKCGSGAKWLVVTTQKARGDQAWPGKKKSEARAESFCTDQLSGRASDWLYQWVGTKDMWDVSDWSVRCLVDVNQWSDQT